MPRHGWSALGETRRPGAARHAPKRIALGARRAGPHAGRDTKGEQGTRTAPLGPADARPTASDCSDVTAAGGVACVRPPVRPRWLGGGAGDARRV